MRKKTAEELRKLMELRRSNAAAPLRNRKKYSRKTRQSQSERLKYKYDTNSL
jgi:hypothetical protein